MHVLRLLHDSLVEGGALLDTQPVGASPLVSAATGPLGKLDMREWTGTIAAVDAGFDEALAVGLFRLEHEERFVVTDSADDAEDLLGTVAKWQQTRIPDALPERVQSAEPPFRVAQDVRLRRLARLP